MADTIKFQCDLDIFNTGLYGLVKKGPTDTSIPMGFEVLLDGVSRFKTDHVTGPCQVTFDINDDEATHKLQFVMTGKTEEHTVINEHGEITSDSLLKISNILIDDIVLDQFLNKLVEYNHDFNGSKDTTTDKFYGVMGCNGTAKFEFTTPFYLWLLENM
jgi:hypothetical protein